MNSNPLFWSQIHLYATNACSGLGWAGWAQLAGQVVGLCIPQTPNLPNVECEGLMTGDSPWRAGSWHVMSPLLQPFPPHTSHLYKVPTLQAMADLAMTHLAIAEPTMADLALADLAMADLDMADLAMADLAMAVLALADLAMADLAMARGLGRSIK